MPSDTGAPWLIPYSLPIDKADDPTGSQSSAEKIAANLTTINSATVMRFTTKALRDSTLVGPLAPKNGMMAYCEDLKRVEVYATMSAALNNWAGWTPLPGTMVAQLYRSSAGQPFTSGLTAAIAFSNVGIDLFGGWSSSPNPTRYTVKVPGMYLVTGLMSFAAGGTAGTLRQGYMGVNGAIVWSSLSAVAGVPTYETTCVIPSHPEALKLNDYVELFGGQYSGVQLNSGATGGAVFPAMVLMYAGTG